MLISFRNLGFFFPSRFAGTVVMVMVMVVLDDGKIVVVAVLYMKAMCDGRDGGTTIRFVRFGGGHYVMHYYYRDLGVKLVGKSRSIWCWVIHTCITVGYIYIYTRHLFVGECVWGFYYIHFAFCFLCDARRGYLHAVSYVWYYSTAVRAVGSLRFFFWQWGIFWVVPSRAVVC